MKELFPENEGTFIGWLDMARERIALQGLPARIMWIGLGDRHKAGAGHQRDGAHRRVEGARGDRAAIIWIRAPSLRRTARPSRLKDGSDAVSDWPLPQCAAQLRLWRHLGEPAPWRRRGHGLLATFGHGDLLRRQCRCRPGA